MSSVSVLSVRQSSTDALSEVVAEAQAALAGRRAALACLFVTMHHADRLGEFGREIRKLGLAEHVIGVTSESVIGGEHEVERDAGLALWLLDLPGVEVQPVRSGFEDGLFLGWNDPPAVEDESSRALILLADPFSFPADDFLARLNQRRNGFRIIGGMASGAQKRGHNRLVIDDEEYRTGAVGAIVSGQITIRTVLSQGCRPIGRHMIVTKSEGNLVRELGRRPAMEVLHELFAELEGPDRDRVRRGLHLGRVINEYQESFGPGDFLVRNVLGSDGAAAIAVNDNVRVGQTVQFHVRDASTADEDLRGMLSAAAATPEQSAPAAALLFSCNGRGSRMFEMPHHDIATVHEVLGPVPTAGFFAMGEIGPVARDNFLHGFTASIGLFYPKSSG
jgi:small ligand-binding sensory domain FIST